MPTPVSTLQLTFDDEFSTFDNSPDGSKGWMTRLPYYGSAGRNLSSVGEIEYYSDSSVGYNPFSDKGGVLGITASLSPNTSKSGGEPYVSGAITTYKSFSQEYGYFEVRANVPDGSGLWSAFWLQPDTLDGKSELDGFEILGKEVGKSSGNVINYTAHYQSGGKGVQDSTKNTVPSDPANGLHTYGLDWEPTGVTWYYDGVAVKTHKGALGGMDEKMFITLNLAVANSGWVGKPTGGSEFPASMQVDYVRAYATAATKYVSGTEAIGLGAPAGRASVTGEVAVGLGVGTPIANVLVSLLNPSGGVVATTKTDSHGDYQFINVAPGRYQVRTTPSSGYSTMPGTASTVAISLTAGEAESLSVSKLVVGGGSSTGGTSTGGTSTGGTATGGGSGSGGTTAGTASLGAFVKNLDTYDGQAGVTAKLLNTSGTVLASATSDANGNFRFTNLAAGTYRVQYVTPSGLAIQANSGTSSSGLTSAVKIGAGVQFTLTHVDVVPAASANTLSVAAFDASSLAASTDDTTITATGAQDETFVLGTAGGGVTTIEGFSTARHDVLDLSQTLAGLDVASDLSNLGSFVTTQVSGGSTTLALTTPDQGNVAFAQLAGVSTTLSQLVAAGEIKAS